MASQLATDGCLQQHTLTLGGWVAEVNVAWGLGTKDKRDSVLDADLPKQV